MQTVTETFSNTLQVDLVNWLCKIYFLYLLVSLDFFLCLDKPPEIISNENDAKRSLLNKKHMIHSVEVLVDSVEGDPVNFLNLLGKYQFYVYVISVAKQMDGDMLEYAAPEIAWVVGGEKIFMEASKNLPRKTQKTARWVYRGNGVQAEWFIKICKTNQLVAKRHYNKRFLVIL